RRRLSFAPVLTIDVDLRVPTARYGMMTSSRFELHVEMCRPRRDQPITFFAHRWHRQRYVCVTVRWITMSCPLWAYNRAISCESFSFTIPSQVSLDEFRTR